MTVTNTSSSPAFPQAVAEIQGQAAASREFGDGAGGMTIRQYFAAHAPRYAEPWFQPLMPAAPERPNDAMLAGLPEPVRGYATSWQSDRSFDLSTDVPPDPHLAALVDPHRETLAAYEAAWTRYTDESQAWQHELLRQRMAQWAWHWADMVLAAQGEQQR
jgi:hypothetical protein